jgi:hypothetical protein
VADIVLHLPSYLTLLSDQAQGKSLGSKVSFAFQMRIAIPRVMSI